MADVSKPRRNRHPLYSGKRITEFDRDLLEASVVIPELTFYFTLDQIATMLAMDQRYMEKKYIYFVGLEPLRRTARKIQAVNMAPSDHDDPDWRVEEKEFRRFVRAMKLRVVESSFRK